jgi:hypothetical protein
MPKATAIYRTGTLCAAPSAISSKIEGALENIVASIVGHEVKTLSYGLYAGAPALATTAEIMKLLCYLQQGSM